MQAELITAPPDVMALAARLVAAGLPQVAVLTAGEGSVAYLAAAPDDHSHAVDPFRGAGGSAPEAPFASLPEWIGVIPYEARRSLERPGWSGPDDRPEPVCSRPGWWRYPAVVRIRHGEVLVAGEGPAVRRLARALERPAAPPRAALRLELAASEPPAAHIERVRRARELILDGDIYQVNLARRLEFRLLQGDAFLLFRRAGLGCRFGALLSLPTALGEVAIVSMSPELLLRAEADAEGRFARLATEPIKGTRPRAVDPDADGALARELDADPKERAELAMIIDVERNDLASVCEVGSVCLERAPEIVSHATVHHRQARLVGRARRDASRSDVLLAMVPSGSVTGAPKIRAMEIIAQLERDRRGLYTGAVGCVKRDGGLTLAMAIRTIELLGERAHYWTGGGIVADSDPERELSETEWKARRLLELAGAPLG